MSEKLNDKINLIKEVLFNMPKNNKKNQLKYLEYVTSLLVNYQKINNQLEEEIMNRYNSILSKVQNIDVPKKSVIQKEYREMYNVLNEWNTPYEKIGLDKCIFEITHFYKNDFDNLNENIKAALLCFEKVGINLTSESFSYSPYVKEYMRLFFYNFTNKDGKMALRDCFDNLYWKCPNIIFHIALNFKYLYYKYEKAFSKYYQDQIKSILSSKSKETLEEEYKNLSLKLINQEEINLKNLINNFLDKTYDIKDYSDEKYEKYKSSITDEELNNNSVHKFYNSLYEYQGYLEYAFIIEEFIKLYNEKDKYKNIYKNALKEIKKIESKIIKLNKKITFQEMYFKNNSKKESLLLELNGQIEIVREKYNELDLDKFYEFISSLNDNISYYDILDLSSSYYLLVREIFKKKISDISEEEINDKLERLKYFLLYPTLNILKNIKVKENINIALMISDRYKLLNLKVNGEDIENNVTNLMDTLEKLKRIYVIQTGNITYEEIAFLCKVKDMIEK